MPGKVGTGATAQTASSGCFTGLRGTRPTDVHPGGEFQFRRPLPGTRPGPTLVREHQQACWRLFAAAAAAQTSVVRGWL